MAHSSSTSGGERGKGTRSSAPQERYPSVNGVSTHGLCAIPSLILHIHRAEHLSEGLAWSFLMSSFSFSARNLFIHH